MTEKRFILSINEGIDGDYDVEFWDYNKHLSSLEVVNLLNKLTDENQKLVNKYREERERVVMFRKDCDRLIEENKKLKQSQASTLREFEKGIKKIQQLTKELEKKGG